MNLINTTEELQGYTRINISVLRESFVPYQRDAFDTFLRKYLGDDLSGELHLLATQQEYPQWADTQGKKEILDKVLDLTRNALAKFTLYLASPHLDLHLSEMGFVVQHTQNSAPASGDRVKKATQAYLEGGHNATERLLVTLEKNHAQIPSYKDSDAYVIAFNNLINTAEVFDRYVSIGKSRLEFIRIRSEMDNVESLVIEPGISPQLVQRLKQGMRNNDLQDHYKKLLVLVQRALANFSVANTIENTTVRRSQNESSPRDAELVASSLHYTKERLTGYGKLFLAKAKKLLDDNPDNFPEYRQSAQYIEERQWEAFDNSNPDNSVFVFGQPS